MPRSEQPRDVVLRLLDGRAERRELLLRGGRERRPFAIGQAGGWRVEARDVAAAHVMLAFNGTKLFVCALPGRKALLDGEQLATRWVEAPVPSVLQFGGARLGIGGRASPEEETQLPPARPSSDDAVTCFDESRLRAALAASDPNGEITCIAEVEIPAAARRADAVVPPALPDSARTLAAAPVAEALEDRASEGEASSMPPTIPSDGLSSVAPPSFSFGRTFAAVRADPDLARPSSPTIAIPLASSMACRACDSLAAFESAALAVSGENAASKPYGDGLAPIAAPGAWRRVVDAWQRASRPKRALAILLMPALISALLTLRTTPALPHPAPSPDVAVAREPVAPEAPPPTAVVPPAAAPAAVGTHTAASGERPQVAVGLHETRTPERRALDTVASGLDDAAAVQYEALAKAHPESVAFREAARILRERGAKGGRSTN